MTLLCIVTGCLTEPLKDTVKDSVHETVELMSGRLQGSMHEMTEALRLAPQPEGVPKSAGRKGVEGELVVLGVLTKELPFSDGWVHQRGEHVLLPWEKIRAINI